MDEWLAQAKFFNGNTFHGKKVYAWAAQAAKGLGNVHTWLSFLYTYGAQPFNNDFSKSTLSTPDGIGATNQWAEMMKYMPPARAASPTMTSQRPRNKGLWRRLCNGLGAPCG
jgi:ABC-type glycerol-3-phosphate transport system substrate-binding protein